MKENGTTSRKASKPDIQTFYLKDDGNFPNSKLPVLYYPAVLKVPTLFPGNYVRKLFETNNWRNAWKAGIFTFDHYHSNTHEVLAIISGETTLQLGGEKGIELHVKKGDVIVLPAGVAHRNLNKENSVTCVGAYPRGKSYDMNHGKPGERPQTDLNIKSVEMPENDPVLGKDKGLSLIWQEISQKPVTIHSARVITKAKAPIRKKMVTPQKKVRGTPHS